MKHPFIGEICRPVRVSSTMRRMLAAGAGQQWRQKLEEVNLSERLSERQFGVGMSGVADHVTLRSKIYHQGGAPV